MPKDDAYRSPLAPTDKVEKIQQETLRKMKDLAKANADKTKKVCVATKDSTTPSENVGKDEINATLKKGEISNQLMRSAVF